MSKVSVRYIVDDVPAAMRFYTTLLGFTLEQDASPAFASVVRDGVRLLLSGDGSSGKRPLPDGRRQVAGGWNRVHLEVTDVAAEATAPIRATIAFLLLLSAPLFAQQAPPPYVYIYRDSLRHGVGSAYGAIEDEAARICADLECPNPYLGLESLSGPHEAWWLNAFASEADTTRVVNAYARNRPLMEALDAVAKRKAPLVGTPIKGFAVHRPDVSRGPAWSVAGARFLLVTVTRSDRPSEGSVWQTADSTLYILRPVRTRQEAEVLAREQGSRIFAVRPNWSMPAPEWVAADPDFWRLAPAPRPRH